MSAYVSQCICSETNAQAPAARRSVRRWTATQRISPTAARNSENNMTLTVAESGLANFGDDIAMTTAAFVCETILHPWRLNGIALPRPHVAGPLRSSLQNGARQIESIGSGTPLGRQSTEAVAYPAPSGAGQAALPEASGNLPPDK